LAPVEKIKKEKIFIFLAVFEKFQNYLLEFSSLIITGHDLVFIGHFDDEARASATFLRILMQFTKPRWKHFLRKYTCN